MSAQFGDARRSMEWSTGNCGDFPYNDFLNWYDPARGIVTSLRRARLLALRKRIGDEAWVKWVKEKKIWFGD